VSWDTIAEDAVYRRAIRASLDVPRIRGQLRADPTVTADGIVEAMSSPDNIADVLAESRRSYASFHKFAGRREKAQELLRDLADVAEWDSRTAAFYAAAALTVLLWFGGAPFLYTLAVPLTLTVGALALALEAAHSRNQVWVWALRTVALLFTWLVLTPVALFTGRRWHRELVQRAAGPVVQKAVDGLLGEDHDSLLLATDYEGLRSPRDPQWLINNVAYRQLRRKIKQIDGGTIAISGPRGVGKTSLLRQCTAPPAFSVFAEAPAAYAPHDFLTSLFVQVCETYIRDAGHHVPEFTRLPHLHRVLGRLALPLQRLVRWLAFALPAAALVTLGLFATARSLQSEHNDEVRGYVSELADTVRDHALDLWHGRAVAAGLVVTCVGVAVWMIRRSPTLGVVLRATGRVVYQVAVVALCCGPFVSLAFDPEVRSNASSLIDDGTVAWWLLLFIVLMILLAKYPPRAAVVRIGEWEVRKRWIYDPLVRLVPIAALAVLFASPGGRAVLTDSENPERILVWLLGIGLGKFQYRSWTLIRTEPKLVAACRRRLYRLQTTQSSSAAVTTGATQLLSLGTSHTTSLSTIPPNYPSLVADFRILLADIAEDVHSRQQRFIIAIDEVDRLGTDAEALDFLREIKAILGVPGVHFLISVAEDVGAAFVRRGLPHRDVTDSSFDDVLHVQAHVLAESTRVLRERADDISPPFVLLSHALSGGIPRDLIRYGRRLMEVRDTTDDLKLTVISRTVILEELSETLAGFRTLLAKYQWSEDTSEILGSFRGLVGHLRTACPCREREEQLLLALEHFAVHAPRRQDSSAGDLVAGEARLLIDEAAAYAYFSLTLLGVFGRPRFNNRMAAARSRGPDGDPELLAEARLELAVSPYSARKLIAGIRLAWDLPDSPTAAAPTFVPPPRSTACTVHHGS
jgi:hypothetical protein